MSDGGRLIFLNRWGGTYTPISEYWENAETNETSAIAIDRATIPPWSHGDAAWLTFTECVRDVFSDFDMAFTEEDPSADPHIELVVGGLASDAGWDHGAFGLGPVDCWGMPSNIAMVFSGVYDSDDWDLFSADEKAQQACSTAAMELGHALGLNHVGGCRDFMSNSESCTWEDSLRQEFVDEELPCTGDWNSDPADCWCTDTPTQNSARWLTDTLRAPERNPPSVRLLSPSLSDILPEEFQVDVEVEDDDAVRYVGLWHDGTSWDGHLEPPYSMTAWSGVAPEGGRWEIHVEDNAGNSTIVPFEVVPEGAGFRVTEVACSR